MALLVAIAFALQCFLTQTHIHGLPQHPELLAHVKLGASTPAGGETPADNSPLDCPYCQAVAHSGFFFTPAAPLLRLPVALGEQILPPITVQIIKSAAIFSRRSRSPPR